MTATIRHLVQYRKERTARKGKKEQDRPDKTGRTGKAERDRQK